MINKVKLVSVLSKVLLERIDEDSFNILMQCFFHSELHITVNLFVQIMLGIPLEMVHRWWRILIIYLAGVVSGSLFTSIIDPEVYLAGASGGVYALLAAHIATIIMVCM